MSLNPAQWAAETIAVRWPSNPKGAFYMIGYGASPEMVDKVLGVDEVDALKTEAECLQGIIQQLGWDAKALRRSARSHETTRASELRKLTKLSRGNKSLRASLERKDKNIRRLERLLNDRPVAQRDRDARVRAEARNLGVDTFMGFSIADHVETIHVAEELAESVRRYMPHEHSYEIAGRFLKLRTPPAPRKVVTRLHCPKCEALVGEEGGKGEPTHYFCPNSKCGWRYEV